jgi:hypothetical protein
VGLGVEVEGEGVSEWEGVVVNCFTPVQAVRASMMNRLPQAALLKALVILLMLRKVNLFSCSFLVALWWRQYARLQQTEETLPMEKAPQIATRMSFADGQSIYGKL